MVLEYESLHLPQKSTRFVGKYSIHGASGFSMIIPFRGSQLTLALRQSEIRCFSRGWMEPREWKFRFTCSSASSKSRNITERCLKKWERIKRPGHSPTLILDLEDIYMGQNRTSIQKMDGFRSNKVWLQLLSKHDLLG